MNRSRKIVLLVCKILVAIILLQTLFFKFTADPQSVDLFSKLGVEPLGRIGSGVIELIASVLLFVPRTVWVGAGLALGTMAGAILAHLTVLGIDYPDGILFYLALAVFCMSAYILYHNRPPFLNKK